LYKGLTEYYGTLYLLTTLIHLFYKSCGASYLFIIESFSKVIFVEVGVSELPITLSEFKKKILIDRDAVLKDLII